LEKGALLNKASIAGVIFGLISGSYIIISLAVSGVEGVWIGFLTSALWLAKLVGCIWLMMAFMRSLVNKYSNVDNSDTFKFGALTALFSAIITGALAYVSSEFMFPDAISGQFDQIYKVYGAMLDSNSMDMLDSITENYSTLSFFGQFIWCTIYGVALSGILSRRIPAADPFRGYTKPEENNETENE